MPTFRWTIREEHTWSGAIEAKDGDEAAELVRGLDLIGEPDSIETVDIDVTEQEEQRTFADAVRVKANAIVEESS